MLAATYTPDRTRWSRRPRQVGRALGNAGALDACLARSASADDSSTFADRVIALDFSPDGKLLATAGGEPSRSGELKLWNVADRPRRC